MAQKRRTRKYGYDPYNWYKQECRRRMLTVELLKAIGFVLLFSLIWGGLNAMFAGALHEDKSAFAWWMIVVVGPVIGGITALGWWLIEGFDY